MLDSKFCEITIVHYCAQIFGLVLLHTPVKTFLGKEKMSAKLDLALTCNSQCENVNILDEQYMHYNSIKSINFWSKRFERFLRSVV